MARPVVLFGDQSSGFVRQSQLIGTKARRATKSRPALNAVVGAVPFSSATLWRMVKSGDFPAPVKLSERVTAWRIKDVREWMDTRRTAS